MSLEASVGLNMRRPESQFAAIKAEVEIK